MCWQPADFSASSCSERFWSWVETGAYPIIAISASLVKRRLHGACEPEGTPSPAIGSNTFSSGEGCGIVRWPSIDGHCRDVRCGEGT